jgi:transcriptional regulator with XRE-family HTH domain
MNSNTKEVVFGPLLKEMRMQKRATLREFCRRANADPGNISRIERGVWPPPQDREILERYAKALDIKEASDDWYRFFDSAAADRGIVPQDIMSREEVVKMLPVFFRTLRRKKPSSEDLNQLVEKLRRS